MGIHATTGHRPYSTATPAAARMPNASKEVDLRIATERLDRLPTAAKQSDFMPEPAILCRETILNQQPGLRHTIGKWTVPPTAGLAAAAIPAGLTWKYFT